MFRFEFIIFISFWSEAGGDIECQGKRNKEGERTQYSNIEKYGIMVQGDCNIRQVRNKLRKK